MILVLALAAIGLGSALQRLTGVGFALVSAPFLVLLLDPFDGVVVANGAAALASGMLFTQLRRSVDWRRFRLLLPAALVGILPGAWMALTLDKSVLDVIVGLTVILGMSASYFTARIGTISGPVPTLGFGFMSGLMNVAAGIGGPALSVYGVATRWSQLSFAATLQPLFFAMGTVSVAVKLIGANGTVMPLPGWAWGAVGAMVVAGISVGTWLAHRINAVLARRLVVVLAYAGGLATLIRGILVL